MNRKQRFIILLAAAAIVVTAIVYWVVRLSGDGDGEGLDRPDEEPQRFELYGIDYTDMNLIEGRIESGHTFGQILEQWGMGSTMVGKTETAAGEVFSLRKIKAGNKFAAFLTTDSIPVLKHFVYEDNVKEYIVFSYLNDSVTVRREMKEVLSERKIGQGTIESSLWASMDKAGMNPSMIKDFENIYQWTIDFFGLQEGDHFTVIYDALSIEGKPYGAENIWGAVFHHNGKDYYAIPFVQEGKRMYWDENGNNLKKSMLKAPVKYSRISSYFNPNRMHPVLRIRRAHNGVDYAAPSGTPVHAVADGTISFRGFQRGGAGNYLKIRHSKGLETQYLHLSRFAKGIAVGKRVSQGDVIGYVGSTGISTGPHLDYRVYINGKPTDPLKVTSQPIAPISKANRGDFDMVRDRVMAELAGELGDKLPITQLDSLNVYRKPVRRDTVPAVVNIK